MRRLFLIILRYLISCPSHLLLGGILLVVPPFVSILLITLWKNQDFLWAPLFFGTIGYFLLIPSAFTAAPPSEKRIARNTLLVGLAVMLSLCFVTTFLHLSQENAETSNSKNEILNHSLESQSLLDNQVPQRIRVQTTQPDLKSENFEEGKNQYKFEKIKREDS